MFVCTEERSQMVSSKRAVVGLWLALLAIACTAWLAFTASGDTTEGFLFGISVPGFSSSSSSSSVQTAVVPSQPTSRPWYNTTLGAVIITFLIFGSIAFGAIALVNFIFDGYVIKPTTTVAENYMM
jgi:cytochrome b561